MATQGETVLQGESVVVRVCSWRTWVSFGWFSCCMEKWKIVDWKGERKKKGEKKKKS